MADKTPDIRTISKTYNIREDQALTVPLAVQDVLGWRTGDEMVYEVDVANQKLIVSRKPE